MIIPSFGSFAPKPDLAGSFVRGAGLAQADRREENDMQLGQQRLAQAAQQAGQEIQLGQQRIAAQQAQAAMELQAKQQAAQQQAMRQDQMLQIEKAEKDARLGLEQRRLDETAKVVQMKVGEAARKFQAQQMFQKESQDLIAGGMDADKAFSQTALKYGPMLGIPGSAYSRSGIKAPGGADFGGASLVAGLPEGFRQIQTGPSSRQIIKLPASVEAGDEAQDIPGLEGRKLYRGKVYTEQESPDQKSIRRRLNALETAQDKDPAKSFAESNDKLSKGKQMLADTYKARAAEISKLKRQLKGGDEPASAQDFEGKRVRSKKTSKLGRVVDGEFVPDEE